MDCPKCHAPMAEASMERMVVDRCTACFGIWFDSGEAERLKDKWMSEFLDSGDIEVGKANDEITDINCPICGKQMEHVKDADQPHIGYEISRVDSDRPHPQPRKSIGSRARLIRERSSA